MRPNAVNPPKEWPTPGAHTRFVEIDLCALTPIFKGGSTTEKIDKDRPFRVPAIRGALRYWWRATSGVTDVENLRTQEMKLFGGVHCGGPVASAIRVGILEQNSKPGPRPDDKPYAFGVTGNPPQGKERHQVHIDATGKLRVEWGDTDVGEEVKRALKAWLLFGGIGGRSRRGAGSVWWDNGLPRPLTIEDYIAEWRALIPTRTTNLWPTLAGSVLVVGPARNSADAAWKEGLDGMRDVRASEGVRPGFAQYRGDHLFEWKRKDYVPISAGEEFVSPRAALGLPIRFNSRGNGFRGLMEPGDAKHNRFPSPLHLKILQMERWYQPVILVVGGPVPLELRAGRTRGELDGTGLDRFLKLAAQLPGWERYE
jgi:CRISPR-associated protein Cmr1